MNTNNPWTLGFAPVDVVCRTMLCNVISIAIAQDSQQGIPPSPIRHLQGNLEVHQVRIPVLANDYVFLLVQIDIRDAPHMKFSNQSIQGIKKVPIYIGGQRKGLSFDECVSGHMPNPLSINPNITTDTWNTGHPLKFR
jgi:hypothetical protein